MKSSMKKKRKTFSSLINSWLWRQVCENNKQQWKSHGSGIIKRRKHATICFRLNIYNLFPSHLLFDHCFCPAMRKIVNQLWGLYEHEGHYLWIVSNFINKWSCCLWPIFCHPPPPSIPHKLHSSFSCSTYWLTENIKVDWITNVQFIFCLLFDSVAIWQREAHVTQFSKCDIFSLLRWSHES